MLNYQLAVLVCVGTSHWVQIPAGCACVCRNLPLGTDSVNLKKQLLKFGAVTYCRLMSSKTSATPTGSAFVKFVTPLAAQRCIQAAACDGEGVIYGGSSLNVLLAVPTSEISKQSNKKEKEDKRNLNLAMEGG